MDAGGRATQEQLPDAEANVRAANGPQGTRQEPRVIQLLTFAPSKQTFDSLVTNEGLPSSKR